MRTRAIGGLMIACLAVALVPVVLWLMAVVFDGIDDRWLDSLAGLGISVPIALGLAAVALAAHGMRLHEDMAEELILDYDAIAHQSVMASSAATVGISPTNGSAVAVAVATENRAPAGVGAGPAAPGGTMTVVAPPEAAGKAASKAGKTQKRIAGEAKRKAGMKAKSAATRAIRQRFRL